MTMMAETSPRHGPEPGRRAPWLAVVVALFAVAYIAPLGVRPLIVPDESRYAEVPREMIASGNWVSPRLNGVRYFEKPVLGYWLSAVSLCAFGESRFAVRLPMALTAGLTACLLYVLVARHGGGWRMGLLGAGVLLTSMLFFAVGTFAVLDMPLTCFLTGAMVCFYFASEAKGWRRRGYEVLFGLCCGLAFMTKGFLAFAVPVVAIGPFMLWERRWRDLIAMVWVPLLTAVLVSLPWGLAIHAREPDFWNFFFWHEHVKRFFSSTPQHPEAPWFFVPILLGGLLPWTSVLPAAIAGLRRRGLKGERFLRFCLCWFVFPFLFFSASRGKLGTYILPCLPPVAYLMAAGLWTYLGGASRKLFDRGAYIFAAIPAAGGLVLLAHGISGLRFLPVFRTDGGWAVLGIGLLVWAALLALSGRQSGAWRKLASVCLGPVLFMAVAGAVFPTEAGRKKAPETFLREHALSIAPGTAVVTDKALVQAVAWVLKRDDLLVLGSAGELAYGLGCPDAGDRLLDAARLSERIAALGPGESLVLIAESKHYREWKPQLPDACRVYAEQGFAMARFGCCEPGGDVPPPPAE